MFRLTHFRSFATAVALLLPLLANAAEPVLARSGNLTVDASDIRGDSLRLPPEHRTTTLADPRNVQQNANNLLLRRMMAAEAEAAGLDKDPAVQAALRIARDRVLSEMLIARVDASSKPAPDVVDKLAEASYKSNPTRFQRPPETRARHILILSSTPDAKAKAEALLAQLKGGADFEQLAKANSEDPGSAARGGDLGFFAKGRMVAPFDAALEALQAPGQLSGIVETQFGYHIIKLEGRRPAGTYTYDEVKEALRTEAEARAIQEARVARVQQLQEQIKFESEAIEAFANTNKPSVVRR